MCYSCFPQLIERCSLWITIVLVLLKCILVRVMLSNWGAFWLAGTLDCTVCTSCFPGSACCDSAFSCGAHTYIVAESGLQRHVVVLGPGTRSHKQPLAFVRQASASKPSPVLTQHFKGKTPLLQVSSCQEVASHSCFIPCQSYGTVLRTT